MITRYLLLLQIAVVLLAISGCERNLEKMRWKTGIVMPLASSSLTTDHLIADSLYDEGTDSLVSLIYQRNLPSLRLDSTFNMSVKPFRRSVSVDSLRLSNTTVQNKITLEEVLEQEGYTGVIQDGDSAEIPNDIEVNPGTFNVDANQYFESMTLKSGKLDITISNSFPTALEDLQYELRNQDNGNTVISDTIPRVGPDSSVTRTYDLSNTTVEGDLEYIIHQVIVKQTNEQVEIDYEDSIAATLTLRDLQIQEATAIFPSQEIINYKDTVSLQGMEDVELKSGVIASGDVNINVVSTVEDTLYFTYRIPSASKNGNTFVTNTVVPPAPGPSSSVQKSFNYDFSGYRVDFTGMSHYTNLYNTFWTHLTGRIDSTGELVHLTLEDSVRVEITIENLEPSYVEGYLGQETFSVSGSRSINLFDNVMGGSLNLNPDNMNISFAVENGFGVDGELQTNQIEVVNSENGQRVTGNLNGSSPYSLAPATNGDPPSPGWTELAFNNPDEMLEAFPDHMNYDFTLQMNPGGNQGSYNDFAYRDHPVQPSLNMEVPLHFSADNLILQDTNAVGSLNIDPDKKILGGTLRLFAVNEYPFEVHPTIYLLNHRKQILDSITTQKTLQAAELRQNSDRTAGGVESKLEYKVDKGGVDNIRRAQYMVFRMHFNSRPDNEQVKIYSDYTIDFNLVGDFDYGSR